MPLDKQAIRKQILAKRMALDAKQVSFMSDLVMQACRPYVEGKRWIGVYLPIKQEIDLRGLYDLCKTKPTQPCFAIPYVSNREHMDFVKWQPDMETKRSPLGIWETVEKSIVPPLDLDVIFVPLIAFHPNGNRIGYGGGYYDRYLPKTQALTIGVAYEFQRCDQICADAHDIRLDHIITEQHTYPLII